MLRLAEVVHWQPVCCSAEACSWGEAPQVQCHLLALLENSHAEAMKRMQELAGLLLTSIFQGDAAAESRQGRLTGRQPDDRAGVQQQQ